jgi:hypothetical protein
MDPTEMPKLDLLNLWLAPDGDTGQDNARLFVPADFLPAQGTSL